MLQTVCIDVWPHFVWPQASTLEEEISDVCCLYVNTCVDGSVGFVAVSILSKFIIDMFCNTCFITGCSEELCFLLAERCSRL